MQVLTFGERALMESLDREGSKATSPEDVVRFPELQPVRLSLADHIADSPNLWQAWNSPKLQRSDILDRLIQDPKQLASVLQNLNSRAEALAPEVRHSTCFALTRIVAYISIWA